jgi:hypothetical protein
VATGAVSSQTASPIGLFPRTVPVLHPALTRLPAVLPARVGMGDADRHPTLHTTRQWQLCVQPGAVRCGAQTQGCCCRLSTHLPAALPAACCSTYLSTPGAPAPAGLVASTGPAQVAACVHKRCAAGGTQRYPPGVVLLARATSTSHHCVKNSSSHLMPQPADACGGLQAFNRPTQAQPLPTLHAHHTCQYLHM